MQSETPLASLRGRVGLEEARKAAAASEYSDSLIPVIDAVLAEPERLWRVFDAVQMAHVVSAFNLDRTMKKAIGFDFAELVDRARVDHALRELASGNSTVDEVAEIYWPPRTRAQQLKELNANIAVVDNKKSSKDNLDEALRRMLDLDLDTIVGRLKA